MNLLRKDPNAPAQVRQRQAHLKGVRVAEISSVDTGANQFADVVLWKAKAPKAKNAAAGRRGMRKVQQVLLDEAASSGPAHAHGPAEMPDGPISAGTYRFGTGGEEQHVHTVVLPADLEPGGQVELVSSIGGPTPHQHDVTIQARVTVQSRYKRLIEELAKAGHKVKEGESDELLDLIEKVDGEPRTLEEQLFERRLHQIDQAVDERSAAFMTTTYHILMSNVDDKEARLLQAVDDFRDLMIADVPDLMAGRLAKGMTDFLSGDGPPTFSDVRDRVAKLLPSGAEGVEMFENATTDEKAALEKMWTAALAGGVSADALAKSLAEKGVSDAEIARLRKVVAGGDTEPEVHPLLKGKTEAEQALLAPVIEFMTTEVSKATAEVATLKTTIANGAKVAKLEHITVIAKGFTKLATPLPEMIEMLQKADSAGCLETVQKTLEAANEAATLGLVTKGSNGETVVIDGEATEIGFAKAGDVGREADARLVAKAVELRKGREADVTVEQAYIEATNAMPEDAGIAAGNTH